MQKSYSSRYLIVPAYACTVAGIQIMTALCRLNLLSALALWYNKCFFVG